MYKYTDKDGDSLEVYLIPTDASGKEGVISISSTSKVGSGVCVYLDHIQATSLVGQLIRFSNMILESKPKTLEERVQLLENKIKELSQ
jgi:hypothetical protein